ncbi:MAG: glycosyltransferase [Actinomycetota bacterium]
MDGWTGPVEAPSALSRRHQGTAEDRVLLVPAGVELVDDAEARITEMLVHDPDIDLAYFDAIVARAGQPDEAAHRPGFSPDRLLGQDYLGPVVLIRRDLLRRHRDEAGPFELPLDRDRLADLAARSPTVAHLPQLIYATELAPDPGELPDGPPSDRPSPRRPAVSIIMPTMGATRRIDQGTVTLCLQALDSVVTLTSYRPLEIVLVVTPGTPDDLQARLAATIGRHPAERRPAVRICRDDRPFNFANACNRGAIMARGEVLVFLNDDTEVVTPDWLDRLVGWATEPGIGAVGARLLYGDGTIQHAGIWSRGGHPAHRYQGFRADHPGHLGSLQTVQNCLAVTGACLAVEGDKFHRAGGFCPEFPSSYNDVDLCLKLDALGHRTVVDPGAVLHHHEASSRDPVIEDWERELLNRRWRRLLIADPNDNPNHLAPGADEYPPPDPAVTLRKQRRSGYGHPARLWRRPTPATDLIDLERSPATVETSQEEDLVS